jgi:uncharacterized protein YhhL (DUF1145 family)
MVNHILFSPLMNTTQDVAKGFIGLLGFIISLALTAVLIILLRKPLALLLGKLIDDETITQKISLFIFALLALAGLYSAIGAFYPDRYANLFNIDNKFQVGEFFHFALYGLLNLLSGFAEVLKWAVVAVAIFFVGYSIHKMK